MSFKSNRSRPEEGARHSFPDNGSPPIMTAAMDVTRNNAGKNDLVPGP